MTNRAFNALLFVYILAVPLIGLGVSEGIRAYFNSQLHTRLLQHFPDADPAAISKVSIDTICEQSDPRLTDFCSMNANLRRMSAAALGAGALGIALLAVIRLSGWLARNNRSVLLMLFKPGLYLTELTVVILILIHVTVAMGAIYYAGAILLHRVGISLLAMIALGGILGVATLLRNSFSLVRKAQIVAIGCMVSQDEVPELWTRVHHVADQLGSLRPDHIVVGLDPNFFVTEADVICLTGKLSGRTLHCSLPLARVLSQEELSAVIGHELGHFKGFDTKFSQRFYPIYRGTADSIISLVEASGGIRAYIIPLLPAVAILGFFLKCFSIAEHRIRRERELAADQAGASVTQAFALASALVKVHAFSGLWGELRNAAVAELHEGKTPLNVSKMYAHAIVERANPEALRGIEETHVTHPTDSHPPLGIRLQALGITLEAVSEEALNVFPMDAAILLISNSEAKEEELTSAYQDILAERIGVDLDSAKSASSPKDNTEVDFDQRVLCTDENCIGVIGSDGCCKECGKPHPGYNRTQI